VRVPLEYGRTVVRTTGTTDKGLADQMERLVKRLARMRRWDLLAAVEAGRVTLGQLYDAEERGRLDSLLASTDDVLLAQHLDAWERSVGATLGATGSAENYRNQVTTLIGPVFRRSELTPARISAWLAGLTEITTGTRRKYLYALSSFVSHLRAAGVLDHDPLEGVKRPKNNPPRMRYESLDNILRLVRAQPGLCGVFCAFIHATGAEVSPALNAKRRDIDLERRRCRIRGTKTATRDRPEILIAEWAVPFVEPHLITLGANELAFPGLDRYAVYDSHVAACERLGIEEYTQHDARHSWAVRAIRAGAPFEVVARQLGHKNTGQVVTVYGRFVPTADELTAWERIAAAQDAATHSATPTPDGQSSPVVGK
jgi:integrase